MPDHHGKYMLSEPLKHLFQVQFIIEAEEMFEWKGKLYHYTFIVNLPLMQILIALKYGSLRHAIPKESTDADQETA